MSAKPAAQKLLYNWQEQAMRSTSEIIENQLGRKSLLYTALMCEREMEKNDTSISQYKSVTKPGLISTASQFQDLYAFPYAMTSRVKYTL